jgi:hypothetical protein
MMTKKTNISLLLLQTSSAHPSFNAAFLNQHIIRTAPSSIASTKTRLFYVQDSIPENNNEPPSTSSSSTTTTPEEEKDQVWMSATRTLGSLFLHQQDAALDVNQENNINSLVDNNTTTKGETFHESVFSSYLLNLKREEEVNREKSSHDDEKKRRKKDVEKSEGKLKEITVDFVIDQVNICVLLDVMRY